MHSPAMIGSARRISQSGGIAGHWVPAGTGVQMNVYACGRSSLHWRDPDSFLSERWLGDEKYKDDRRDALQPFSYGGLGTALEDSKSFIHNDVSALGVPEFSPTELVFPLLALLWPRFA